MVEDILIHSSGMENTACCYNSCVCVQDFHRKLEIEKVEWRRSDSQALQLLEEVREQGKIAQQLREGEARLDNYISN